MSWQTDEPTEAPPELASGTDAATDDLDLTDAEDTTEDDAAVLAEPAPSPYADPEQDTDGPQDETP